MTHTLKNCERTFTEKICCKYFNPSPDIKKII